MSIQTTHVGSLPRSQDVVDFIFAREKGDPYDQDAFDACMTQAVSETVRRQVTAGVDIVSDGETSKISYATYVKDRYTGFDGDSPRNAPADLKMFPGFLDRIAREGGTPKFARPMCMGEVRSKGQGELEKDIANLKSAMAAHGATRGFMNAASPGVISLFLQNAHYPTREAYLAALADAMKAEYETIVAAGLDLQLDCPDLALSRHMLFADLSDEAFVKIAAGHVEALNHATQDIPEDRIRIHICWGNYEGPHVCDIPMAKMFDTLMTARARDVLFETSNPRHGHEWEVFAERRRDIPEDKVLVPGVVDTTTNFVEHPRLVAQRVARLALLDTNPLAEAEAVRARRLPQIEKVRAGSLAEVMRDEMKPNYLAEGPGKAAVLDLCMDMALGLGPQVFLHQSLALMTRPDQCETLRRYRGKTLILCGRDDALCPVARHELMHDLVAGSRLRIVDGAAHLPTLEQRAQTTAALARWLEE